MGGLLLTLMLLPRPVLSGTELIQDAGTTYKVHYTLTGQDALANGATDIAPDNGVPDDVDAVSSGVTTVFDHWVTGAGMRAPLSDGTLGGDGRIDVYLRQLDGPRGYTHEEDVGLLPATSAWIELDPRTALTSEDRFAAAAGHEAHHSIQYAYSPSIDLWFEEATATYVENSDFAGLQSETDAHYLSILAMPGVPLNTTNGVHEYDEMVFIRFLMNGVPDSQMATLWERAAQVNSLDAINTVYGPLPTLLFTDALWLSTACDGGAATPGNCSQTAQLASAGLSLPGISDDVALPALSIARVDLYQSCSVTISNTDALASGFAAPAFLPNGSEYAVPVPTGNPLYLARGQSSATTVTILPAACNQVPDMGGADSAASSTVAPGCSCALGGNLVGESGGRGERGRGAETVLVTAISLFSLTRRRRAVSCAARPGDPARPSPA